MAARKHKKAAITRNRRTSINPFPIIGDPLLIYLAEPDCSLGRSRVRCNLHFHDCRDCLYHKNNLEVAR